MMKALSLALVCCLYILAGCTTIGGATFQSSERLDSSVAPIDSLQIDIHTTFQSATYGQTEHLTFALSPAAEPLQKAFLEKFNAANVNTSITTNNVIRNSNSSQGKHLLILSINSMESVTKTQSNIYSRPPPIGTTSRVGMTNWMPPASDSINANLGFATWTGKMSWNAVLFSALPAARTQGVSPMIWKAKTNVHMFGPSYCSSDAYKTCSEKFADSVLNQMRSEKLIK